MARIVLQSYPPRDSSSRGTRRCGCGVASRTGTLKAAGSSGITLEPSRSGCVAGDMKRITVAIGLIAALALPAGAQAKPNNDDEQAAQKQCKAERGKTKATREAFKARHSSMSRCVREKAAEEEAERKEAKSNAARDCKAERQTLGGQAFADKYGENKNKKNAFGKCVSTKAREKKAEMDAEDQKQAQELRNAAKECAAERRAMGEGPFADKYGKNKNKKNAFGKCVSMRAGES
jgi:hypothetical protein